MFFFFSKLSYFFLSPANWLLVLVVVRLFAKNSILKKRLTVALIIITLLFGNEVIYNKLVLAWQPKPVTLPENTTYNTGILLGGITSFDKNKQGFLNGASDRFIATYNLYKTGHIKKIIISGGAIYKNVPKEADFLRRAFIKLGVPEDALIVETSSRSTTENAVFTKQKIDSLQIAPPYILITSAMHVPRAALAFKKVGIDVIPYPCNYTVLDKNFDIADYLIPKLSVINSWFSFLKEIIGIIAYKILQKG